MKAEDFYKQRSNSIRELWALSPKQIEYIGLIMEEYAALRQPPVSSSFSSESDHICVMYLDKQRTCMVCGKQNCC